MTWFFSYCKIVWLSWMLWQKAGWYMGFRRLENKPSHWLKQDTNPTGTRTLQNSQNFVHFVVPESSVINTGKRTGKNARVVGAASTTAHWIIAEAWCLLGRSGNGSTVFVWHRIIRVLYHIYLGLQWCIWLAFVCLCKTVSCLFV